MASTYKQASWNKYFQTALNKSSGGHICTSVKPKDGAKLYDMDSVVTNDIWPRGGMVRVFDQTYPSNHLIAVKVKKSTKWKEYRIHIDVLEKPGTSSGVPLLKPQEFGLKEDIFYTFDQARDQILKSLDERTDLPGTVKEYLELLLLYESEGNTVPPADVQRAFESMKEGEKKKWMNDILKDYGETIGPFACYGRSLIEGATNGKFKVERSARIWWPEDPAFPLLDYGLRLKASDKTMLNISAKTWKLYGKEIKGNTVKSGDVLTLLDRVEPKSGRKQLDLKEKWRRKLQYGVLQDLDNNSSWSGPAIALRRMIKKGVIPQRKAVGLTKAAVDDLTKNGKATLSTPASRAKWKTFEDNNEIIDRRRKVKGRAWKGMSIENLRYATEVVLHKACAPNATTSFADIFADAIMNTVIYVKFGIERNGLPVWKAKSAYHYRNMEKVCFRSTNQFDSGKGKIGLDTT